MWFYGRRVRISWTGHVINEEILRIIETKQTGLLRIQNIELECLGSHDEQREFKEILEKMETDYHKRDS